MTKIKKEIVIDAPIERVWEYLVDKDKLASWMMKVDSPPAPGQTFRFVSEPQEKWDGVIVCRVKEMDPPRKFVFGWEHNVIGGETVVSITLEAEGSGTRLTLVHDGWENTTGDVNDFIAEHTAGWNRKLDGLKAEAEKAAKAA